MRKAVLIFLLLPAAANSFSFNKICYLEPRPEANYVSIDNNIVIGLEKPITLGETDILKSLVVMGSKSGVHFGTLFISSDRKKIILKPSAPFDFGEKITVRLVGKLLNLIGANGGGYKYSFNIQHQKLVWNPLNSIDEGISPGQSPLLDPPQLSVTINNGASTGYWFLTPFASLSYLMIVDSNGNPFWYSGCAFCGDFKVQPSGYFTFYDGYQYKHFEMDENYNITDTFYCGNGYTTDIHELRVLNNGHAFLIAYDPQIVDMSLIVPGGNPQATVVGLVIQEIDENKNVVFQWRSWDHFEITDALHENLLGSNIDYVHGNAIEIDNDGNLLISSRHLDEITKIDRTTGNIIWRFGGLNNQFTFLTDTLKFTYQHAVRRISNGNITLYDNGNFHSPQYSRAVEYSLDEINKTATLVWQFRRDPDIFGSWGGYVQRLDGGNTLIAWGGARPTVTEVKPDGTVVFEASYPIGVFTYRAYKFSNWGTLVSANHETGTAPVSFKLNRNFPNPFNPVTKITYDIPKASFVELSVFDITGKQLKTLVSAYLHPGSYSASFDGTDYSSGLYVCRLKAGDFTASQKMILLK